MPSDLIRGDTGSHCNRVYADCVGLSAVENASKQKPRDRSESAGTDDDLGAEADRVIADTLGMHLELVGLRNHRIDAVEQALVERRKRIGRAGLAELLLGIRDRHGGRQAHHYRVHVLLDELDLRVAVRHRRRTPAPWRAAP